MPLSRRCQISHYLNGKYYVHNFVRNDNNQHPKKKNNNNNINRY